MTRLPLDVPPEAADWKDWQKARWEADQFASWLRANGLEALRAASWSEVAVLCPRTRWLPVIQAALRKAGLEAQIQSERAIKGDSPAFAWFCALAVCLGEPRNSFEVVGVLRDVFGISDQDLANFSEGKGWRFQIALPNVRGAVVGETLNRLVELRDEAVHLPLFTAMQRMVEVTKLRERLAALPAEDFEGMEEELETLLTHAASAEATGATLETFAADLRTQFESTRDVLATSPDAVQIISGHKAKGSEWDSVIIPFFARKVFLNTPSYPRMLRHPHTRELLAALDGQDLDKDLKQALEAQARQELERLLYVALTRARHSLVLVDDRDLFMGGKTAPKNAQALLLHCAPMDSHAAFFDALPTQPSTCTQTTESRARKVALPDDESTLPPLPPCPPDAFAAARERASFFIKRNPSALAEAASAEADPTAGPPLRPLTGNATNAGARYGTWWHEFVEVLEWTAGPASWKATFANALRHSPDPDRSQREWKLLYKLLTEESQLGRLLTTPGAIAHAELPFLWTMSERECLDGIIDLVVRNPVTGAWLILDWKTNNVTPKGLPELAEHYRPQLSAYWKAVGDMLNAPVSAGIYSTMTGRWMPYTETELAHAWENVQGSPEKLEQLLEDDQRPARG